MLKSGFFKKLLTYKLSAPLMHIHTTLLTFEPLVDKSPEQTTALCAKRWAVISGLLELVRNIHIKSLDRFLEVSIHLATWLHDLLQAPLVNDLHTGLALIRLFISHAPNEITTKSAKSRLLAISRHILVT